MSPPPGSVAAALPLLATAAAPPAGDQVCADCHEKEATRFRATPMARALEPVAQSEILRQHPSLTFRTAASNGASCARETAAS